MNWIPFCRVKNSQDEWVNTELKLLFLLEQSSYPRLWAGFVFPKCSSGQETGWKIPSGWVLGVLWRSEVDWLPWEPCFRKGDKKRSQKPEFPTGSCISSYGKPLIRRDHETPQGRKNLLYLCVQWAVIKHLLHAKHLVLTPLRLFLAWNAKQMLFSSMKCVVES